MPTIYSGGLNFVKRLEHEQTQESLSGKIRGMELVKHPAPRSVDAIAVRLRVTRQALGMKQNAFAAAAGIAPNTYNQWEKAKGAPELGYAQMLCDAHGLSLDWIYNGDAGNLPGALIEKIRAQLQKRPEAA